MNHHASPLRRLRTALAALLLILAVLLRVPPSVSAASSTVRVTGDPVNVRSGAGYSGTVLGKAHKGDVYRLISQKKDASGYLWVQVQYTQSKTGWMLACFTEQTSLSAASTTAKTTTTRKTTATAAAQKKVTITANSVNIRAGCGTSYRKLATVNNGKTYTYLGSQKISGGKVWYKLQFNASTVGWVSSAYSKVITSTATTTTAKPTSTTTTTAKPTSTTTTTAKPTSTTTTTAKPTSTKTTTAKPTSTTTTTAKPTSTTTTTAKPTSTKTTTAKPTSTTTTTAKPTSTTRTTTASANSQAWVRVTGNSINVRSGAGTSYSSVGYAYKDDVFPCLASQKASNGIVWYQIAFTDKLKGWISGAYASRYTGASSVSSPSPVTSPAPVSSAQEAVNRAATRYGAVGVQVAVIRDGKVSNVYHTGWAVKNSVPMSDDSKIRIASISKVAVAMGAMKMREEGLVDMDENIGTYWGITPYQPITLRQLLTHTSYLRDNVGYKGTRAGTAAQLTAPATFRAKNTWSYNNYGAGVAGSTLEVASGQLLDSYMKQKFFSPMGIDASFTSGNVQNTSQLAALYYPSDSVARSVSVAKSLRRKDVGGNTAYFPGGLTISAKDMAKLTAMLANDGVYNGKRYLSASSVAEMEKLTTSGYARDHSFRQGMPLRYLTNVYGQSRLYYHLGTAYGTLSFMGYNPDTKNGVVIITTGASNTYDKYGTFNICADLADYFM